MAKLPEPKAALVIRYSYLWQSEHRRGLEEGSKDRPCAIVLTVQTKVDRPIVTVLPITHVPPASVNDAVEIPMETKRRLGLDDQRSWIVVTEANRFLWPGPDLRRADPNQSASFAVGELPYRFFARVRDAFLANATAVVTRTE